MLTAGPVALACVCHLTRPVQNVPVEGEVEEGVALLLWVFITVVGVFLSNKSELSALLWQRPGSAWAPPSCLPSHCSLKGKLPLWDG